MIGLGEEHEEDGAHLGGLCAADIYKQSEGEQKK